jgi:serine/threonine protein kinase
MSLKKNKKSFIIQANPALTQQYPDLSDYILIDILGSGSFGKVISAKNQYNYQDLAIKVHDIKFEILENVYRF